MGTLHTICNALYILGKRFGDAGLKDICVEAGLVAEGSMNSVFSSKHYKRSLRAHKHNYEALMRLAWEQFTVWVEENHEAVTMIHIFIDQLSNMTDDLNQQSFDKLPESPVFAKLTTQWASFLEHLRHDNGELSAFWMSYIDIMENVVLNLLCATHEGKWSLYLNAIRSMLPWCFAYDKVNYARYLSPYFSEMMNIPEKEARSL